MRFLLDVQSDLIAELGTRIAVPFYTATALSAANCRAHHHAWNTKDTMSLREEFVLLARQESANRRDLCRRFGISPQTGYKWLERYAERGRAGLAEQSR